MGEDVRIGLAGSVNVEAAGSRTEFSALGDLGRLALAYLVLERRRAVPRTELAEILWEGRLPPSWQAALRGVIGRVRIALDRSGLCGASTLTAEDGAYRLNVPPGTIVDVEAAAEALDVGRAALLRADGRVALEAAREALGVSCKPFLPGPDGHWVARRRAALVELRVQALELVSHAAAATGDASLALERAEDAIALDPLRESAHLRAMAAHAAAGNRAAALRAYERCRRTLADEMGVSPSPATEAAYLALLADRPPPVQDGAPTTSAWPAPLPAGGARFIGRSQELAEVKQCLSASRLVSLVGTGGVGKSRLALEAARELSASFRDGAVLVELAGLGDPTLVPQQVLSLVGEPERGAPRSLESLLGQLAPRHLLLVLDNCEHLLAACADLTVAMLTACPRVSVLTTSREPLGVAGEQVWTVPSLAMPDDDQDRDALAACEAVQLFADRARATGGGFRLDDQAVPWVGVICRRLDCIPLAIELAAARTKVLSVAEIAAHLDDRFRLLVGGPRHAPKRHQTLRAAIDWSYEALTPAESALLRRLSVFAGGFTLAAAAAVCGQEGDDGDDDVLESLSALVDKSLVLVDQSRTRTRYGFLETVRQYGEARLDEQGGAETCVLRHLGWATALAEAGERGLNGPDQATWLDTLDAEQDNLRAALDRASGPFVASARPEARQAGMRLAAAMWRYWEIRGLVAEGSARLMAWTDVEGMAPSLRARLLNTAGVLAELRVDLGAARRFYEESLTIRRSLDDDMAVATTLHGLANLAVAEGNHEEARSRFEQNLAIARRIGERRMAVASLLNLAVIAQMAFAQSGDREAASRARAAYNESLDEYRTLGDRHGMALTLHNMATLAMRRGDEEEELAFHEESLAIRRALGDKAGIASSVRYLRNRARRMGDRSMVRQLAEESLTIERELERASGQVDALGCLGVVAMAEGRYEEAGLRFEQAVTLQRPLAPDGRLSGLLMAIGETARRRHAFAEARAAFEEALTVARRDGARRSITWASANLARLAAGECNFREASRFCMQALEDGVGREDPNLLYLLAPTLAGVALDAGSRTDPARILGYADAVRESLTELVETASDIEQLDARAAAVRARLGPAVFEAAWQDGAALPIAEAVALLDRVARTGAASARSRHPNRGDR